MNSDEILNEDAGGGSALNVLLGYFTKEQERLWEIVKESAINNVIPDELPLDAVLFVSSDRFDNLHHHFKMQFAGRVFADNLLEYDSMVIMKRPNAKLTGRGPKVEI